MNKVIWKNTLDNRFLCSVTEETETCGRLEMVDVGTGELVYKKLVPLSKYFREQDVLWWGQECLNFLNSHEEHQSPLQEAHEPNDQG
jgi:hypothetical protein